MRNVINLALVTAVALSSSLGAFAHGGEDDEHHPVVNQQYNPGTYPVAPGTYAVQPGYLGQPGAGHLNDSRYNPGHNNSRRHQAKDAINSMKQGAVPGYAGNGLPGVAQPYGYPGAYPAANQASYLGQPGAGHINDPNYNPGHNNSIGHQLKDAVNPRTAPAYGVPGSVPGYGYRGYQGAPAANHVNNPYVNPGHNGSIQHQVNDAAIGNQRFPAQLPMANRRGRRHDNADGHSH